MKTKLIKISPFFILLFGQACKDATKIPNQNPTNQNYFLTVGKASCNGSVLSLSVKNNTGSSLSLATTTTDGQIENLLYPNAVGDARANDSNNDAAICYDAKNVNFECGCAGDKSCGTIMIDGNATTAFSILELPKGEHTVTLTCDGACSGTTVSCVFGGLLNNKPYATAFVGNT